MPHVPASRRRTRTAQISQYRSRRTVSIQQWQANLRIWEVTEIKTAPYAPLSRPFEERLIGRFGRELLDRTLFLNTANLETKLIGFQHFYNPHRTSKMPIARIVV